MKDALLGGLALLVMSFMITLMLAALLNVAS